jgi:hypothetical protein
MGWVGWILVAALAAVAGVVWLRRRYPGGWRYAFAEQYSKEPHDLDSARSALRGLEREADREREAARAAVQAAERTHQENVRLARARLTLLREPGRGLLRSSVASNLWLYDNVLHGMADGRSAEYPVEEVSIRDEYSRTSAHTYLAQPTGRQQMVSVALDEATPEAEVRAFVITVFNACADAKVARAERLAQIPLAEAELREAMADTAGPEQARRRLAEVADRQGTDTRIPQARKELDAAFERWEQLTGRRPK